MNIRIFLILLISLNSFGQKNEFKDFFDLLKKGHYTKAESVLKKNNLKENELFIYLKILQQGNFDFDLGRSLKNKGSSSLEYNTWLLNNALYLYSGKKNELNNNNEVDAYNLLIQSKNLAQKRNDSVLTCLSIQYILEIYERFHIVINDTSYKYLVEEYEKYAYNDTEKKISKLYEYRIKQRSLEKYSKNYFWNVKSMLKNLNSPIFEAKRDLTHLTHYRLYDSLNYDSTTFYLKRLQISLQKEELGYFEKERLEATKINKAILEYESGKPHKALQTLDSVNIIKNDYMYKLLQRFLFFSQYKSHKALDNEVKYLRSLTNYYKIELSANQSASKLKISDQITKYKTLEKEKKIVQLQNKNLKTEAKRKKNRDIVIGLIILLCFFVIFFMLIYKNLKREQRIAEQEKELEIQKTEKLLKEQELASINAMIVGQEKERQRLANDLHDNLGSTLATVKLHFQHLKNNKGNPKVENLTELYDKTDDLLEEAYQKVRTIAHEKNSGVMANQGLLLAIKKLATKVSNSNQVLIEVQDYGLDQRLDNTLEITIFRIIQELITNIIKHANANEVHISLTNHEAMLNIIVEDNGKGFDATVLPQKEGMGLANIEKRIEHLEGTFEIDSTQGKGTHIIINIPI